MRRHRIRALAGRRFRPCTTDSRHHLAIAPNLLAQRFTAPSPNRIRLADITYIATGEGWLVSGRHTRPGDPQEAEQPKVPAMLKRLRARRTQLKGESTRVIKLVRNEVLSPDEP